jgi:hypothetical protein
MPSMEFSMTMSLVEPWETEPGTTLPVPAATVTS